MPYITCKHCGCQMSDKSEACPVCGASTIEDASQKEDTITTSNESLQGSIPSDTKTKHRNKLLLIGIAFVAVIAIVMITINVHNNKEKQTAEQAEQFGTQHQIAAKQAELNEQKQIEEVKIQKESKKYVVINANELRLRYGPSLDSQTLRWADGTERYATRGEVFKYLGETDEFYKIDYHGNQFWVFKQFASSFESPD